MKATIHTDGAANPTNPGPAGAGWVIEREGGRPRVEAYKALGTRTNNVAEYAAMFLALAMARHMGVTEVKLVTDSMLLMMQLTDVWQVKHPGLVEPYKQTKEMLSHFESVEWEWVPRGMNQDADRLSKLGSAESAATKQKEQS